MPNRSSFVAPNYTPDQFTELLDLPASEWANAQRYQQLKAKTNKTQAEIDEMNQLAVRLQDYLITPERWNKFQDALVNMQWFLKDSVEGYIDQKQTEMQSYVDTKKSEVLSYTDTKKNEMTTYVDTKKSELQTEIDKFTFLGTYSPTTTYNKKNIVEYNGEAYICLIDGTINIPPTNTTNWAKIAQKGAKGDKGDPGLNLVYKGTYDPTKQYTTGDAVEYGGSIYYAKQNSIGETPQSNGTSWTIFMARASILVSSTPPSSPTDKMIWVDSNTNIFKYYNSSTSSWIELNSNDAKTLGGQTLSQIQTDYNNKIGILSNLNTTDKTSLVNALNEVNSNAFPKTLTTLTGVSLDTATTTGFYFADSTCTNLPLAASNYFLQVIRGSNGYIYQIALNQGVTAMYFRRYTTSWSSWYTVATTSDLLSYVKNYAISYSSDLNSLTSQSGFWYATTSATNTPIAGRAYMVIQNYYDSTHKVQTAIDTVTSDFYVRTYNGSAWTAWNKVGGGNASAISITDSGNYYTSSDVEGALQESGQKQSDLEILYWMGAI